MSITLSTVDNQHVKMMIKPKTSTGLNPLHSANFDQSPQYNSVEAYKSKGARMHSQNLDLPNWYEDGLKKNNYLLYLLLWKEGPKPVLKFGYKSEVKNFKRCFVQPYIPSPSESVTWQIKYEDYMPTQKLGRKIRLYHIERTFRSIERELHQVFKQELNFKTHKGYRENYISFNFEEAKSTITKRIQSFGDDMDLLRKQEPLEW